MQESIPADTDVASEPDHLKKLCGKDVSTPGTFAYNCLTARKLVENDVRTVQLFHRGRDHHSRLSENMKGLFQDIDQVSAGLIKELKQRGLLEDTLVVWGKQFLVRVS